MLIPQQLESATAGIQEYQTAAATAAVKLKAELATIDREKFKPEHVEVMEKQVREKYIPAIRDAVNGITAIHDGQLQVKKFWASKEFVISNYPVTEPKTKDNPLGGPADANAETLARLAKSQEYNRMPDMVVSCQAENSFPVLFFKWLCCYIISRAYAGAEPVLRRLIILIFAD